MLISQQYEYLFNGKELKDPKTPLSLKVYKGEVRVYYRGNLTDTYITHMQDFEPYTQVVG